MRRGYFFKKNLLSAFSGSFYYIFQAVSRFFKFVFAKRTLLFVTNEQIRSVTFGPSSQLCIFLFLAWVGNLFAQSLNHDKIISEKSKEINRLSEVNGHFESEFGNVNDKLKKINEYLISITGKKHTVKAREENSQDSIEQKPKIEDRKLSKQDKQTFKQIGLVDKQVAKIHDVARNRISHIEKAMVLTGLNMKKIPQQKLQDSIAQVREVKLSAKKLNKRKSSGQGGPLILDNSLGINEGELMSDDELIRHLDKLRFTSEVDYLMALERLVEVMPFSRPMKNYYISSGYGKRIDPITSRRAIHQGLDFVGPKKEPVLSPSQGKVVKAGRYSDYGNAVVLDHGFGIKTRYGHLSKVIVKVGDVVNQGDIIGLQGNTGRSTGAHLHYEVRYKNQALNPSRFIRAGDKLFNSKAKSKYVNS